MCNDEFVALGVPVVEIGNSALLLMLPLLLLRFRLVVTGRRPGRGSSLQQQPMVLEGRSSITMVVFLAGIFWYFMQVEGCLLHGSGLALRDVLSN